METPGNQVDETVQEIGSLTLSEQGVETGDGLETGDAGETQQAVAGAGALAVAVSGDFMQWCAEQSVEMLEWLGKFMTPMLDLIDGHVVTGQGDSISIMKVARSIKENTSRHTQKPIPLTVKDWMNLAELAGYGPCRLIFLWCACCSADCHRQVDDIGRCLDQMHQVVIATEDDHKRGILGNVLCILSENLEAVFETPDNDLGKEWFKHIILRCIGNKASGFVQQLKFREGIEVYESRIAKMRQRLGDNVMVAQYLTMLGRLRLSLDADSSDGLKNLKEARTVLDHAEITSNFEEECRTGLLELLGHTLEVERDEKPSRSEQEDSRKEKSVSDRKSKFLRSFKRFFRRFPKRKEQSNDPSARRSAMMALLQAVQKMDFTPNK